VVLECEFVYDFIRGLFVDIDAIFRENAIMLDGEGV
jgi:hypothetical protein